VISFGVCSSVPTSFTRLFESSTTYNSMLRRVLQFGNVKCNGLFFAPGLQRRTFPGTFMRGVEVVCWGYGNMSILLSN
jgi:hypothetical protein